MIYMLPVSVLRMKTIILLVIATHLLAGMVYSDNVRAIHIFVALCDNESQGIVPVPQHLGNGDDPGNNLYWGAMYGVKTFLKNSPDWEFVIQKTPVNERILERIILKHKSTGTYLVADACRGSTIRSTIDTFLHSAAGHYPRYLVLGGLEVGIYGNSALVAYIGHNGLMDFHITPPQRTSAPPPAPAVIVLACKSESYFKAVLMQYRCSPQLLTTGFMAPEAYTLEAALEAWLLQEGPGGMKEAAAQAYNQYQKCGLNGARNLFAIYPKD